MPFDTENPYLLGNFAPVEDELDVDDLAVDGTIPDGLDGVYMRNGPNPAYAPISYTYPFDGDGMIHAVYLEGGRARYRNRFVETKGLGTERRAGRAIYGGLGNPIPPDPALVGEGGGPGPVKNGAFIHIIRHAGNYLAMYEGAPPYEVTAMLATVGEWSPVGGPSIGPSPHTRFDPQTGELFLVAYDLKPPFLACHVVGPDGKLVRSTPIDLPLPTMVHDFALTERYVVIFIGLVTFDVEAAGGGGNPLRWQAECGTRIGLLSRSDLGAPVRWIEAEPFFVFHFGNAFESASGIAVDYVRHERLTFGFEPANTPATPPRPPLMYRANIDLALEAVSETQVDEVPVEFPRFNETRNTKPSRFVYATAHGEPAHGSPGARAHKALAKFDMESRRATVRRFENGGEAGEPIFIPTADARDEDDGFLLTFVYDPDRSGSDLVILDARDITAEPVAVVRMPRRIPHGLHGSWMPQPL